MGHVRLPIIGEGGSGGGAASTLATRSTAPSPPIATSPLTDGFERRVRYLRVSVTDRCNYRCTYCRPEAGVHYGTRQEVLRFEEIERVVAVFAGLGVERVRLTGGEPTVRSGIAELVARLVKVPGIREVVMTSNGHLLAGMAGKLAAAGLGGVNVSIDTLDAAQFRALTRGGDLAAVMAGVEAALAAGLEVKLNAVALRGVTEAQVEPLCRFAWQRHMVLRFIEHMPLSDGELFAKERHLSAAELRAAIEATFGPLVAEAPRDRIHGPARYHHLAADPSRRLGIISAMTEHFCDDCNRVRLSAAGDLHACLGYDDATSLRDLMRCGASDDQLADAIRGAMAGKRLGHDFQLTGAGAPKKHMISIGG